MTDVRKTEPMQKDRSQKCLEDYSDVFADIFNHLVFDEPLICQDELMPGPTESIYKAGGNNILKEQRRDVSKYLTRLNLVASLIGMKNQTVDDPDMGIRVLGYDYGSYRQQIISGDDRYACLTAVLYFGKAAWKSGSSLKEQIGVPDKLNPYVNDYKIHLIDVPRLPKEKRLKLTSDFRVIADFFAEKDREDYKPSRQEIVHVEEVLQMLRVFTNDERYENIEEDIMASVKRGERVSMCDFADRMERQGIEKGRQEGKILGEDLFAVLTKKLIADSRIEDLTRATEDREYRKALYKEYGI